MVRSTKVALLGASLCLASPGLAQEALFPRGVDSVEVDDPMIPMGISASIGGSTQGFIDDVANTNTDPGGGWDVRLGLLTRFVVSAELAYIGSAQEVHALGLDEDAILLSNGAEAALRVNVLPGVVQPYFFGGIGWRHYEIVNESFNTSSILDEDDVGHVPVGAGLTVRIDNFLLDARGTFRLAFEDEMLDVSPVEEANMHTWAAELRAGVEL